MPKRRRCCCSLRCVYRHDRRMNWTVVALDWMLKVENAVFISQCTRCCQFWIRTQNTTRASLKDVCKAKITPDGPDWRRVGTKRTQNRSEDTRVQSWWVSGKPGSKQRLKYFLWSNLRTYLSGWGLFMYLVFTRMPSENCCRRFKAYCWISVTFFERSLTPLFQCWFRTKLSKPPSVSACCQSYVFILKARGGVAETCRGTLGQCSWCRNQNRHNTGQHRCTTRRRASRPTCPHPHTHHFTSWPQNGSVVSSATDETTKFIHCRQDYQVPPLPTILPSSCATYKTTSYSATDKTAKFLRYQRCYQVPALPTRLPVPPLPTILPSSCATYTTTSSSATDDTTKFLCYLHDYQFLRYRQDYQVPPLPTILPSSCATYTTTSSSVTDKTTKFIRYRRDETTKFIATVETSSSATDDTTNPRYRRIYQGLFTIPHVNSPHPIPRNRYFRSDTVYHLTPFHVIRLSPSLCGIALNNPV